MLMVENHVISVSWRIIMFESTNPGLKMCVLADLLCRTLVFQARFMLSRLNRKRNAAIEQRFETKIKMMRLIL